MIKNFVVKVKQVKYADKGLKNLLNYLVDEKRHPNGIINIKQFSKERFFKQTILNITEHNLNKHSGRKIESFADSYIFTLPPELYDKGLENKEVLVTELVKEITKVFNSILEININQNEIINNIFLNIHKDKNHLHINVVFPRILKLQNQLISNRITNRRKFLYNIKQSWNYIITKNLNLSINDYKPKTKFKRGYKNQYFKDLINENNEVLKQIEKQEQQLLELNNLIKLKRKDLKEEINKLIKENEKRTEIINTFQLVIRYFKSFIKEVENNKEKIKKEYFKLNQKIKDFKAINKIKELNTIINEIEKNKNYLIQEL